MIETPAPIQIILDEELKRNQRPPAEVVGDYLPTVEMFSGDYEKSNARYDVAGAAFFIRHADSSVGPSNRLNGRKVRLTWGFSLGERLPQVDSLIATLNQNQVCGQWNLAVLNKPLSDAVAFEREKAAKKTAEQPDIKPNSTIGDVLLSAHLLGNMRLLGFEQLKEMQNGYLDSGDLSIIAGIQTTLRVVDDVYAELMTSDSKRQLLGNSVPLNAK